MAASDASPDDASPSDDAPADEAPADDAPAAASPSDDASERTRTRFGLAVDMVMLVLIVANLTLIVIDAAFSYRGAQALLYDLVPGLARWYDATIHAHFVAIDLAFVAVFVAEIAVRWGLAIRRQTYHRWFFYPFMHWYDVLGCIPIGGLRFLRVLRIFALLPKVQRLGLVDLTTTYPYVKFTKYRDILIEEVTDRVTLKILDGVQAEIQRGHPVTDRIVQDVIVPKRTALVEAVTHRLQEATAEAYGSFQDDFRTYVDRVIAEAVEQNREIGTIALIPGVGTTIAGLLESAIADIVYTVIDRMMGDIGSMQSDEVIAQITGISTDALLASKYDQTLNRLVKDALVESLDEVKAHVAVKQWKLEQALADDAATDVAPARSA